MDYSGAKRALDLPATFCKYHESSVREAITMVQVDSRETDALVKRFIEEHHRAVNAALDETEQDPLIAFAGDLDPAVRHAALMNRNCPDAARVFAALTDAQSAPG